MLRTINDFDLKGKVKSCNVNTYKYNENGDLEKDIYHRYFVKFNEENLLIAFIDSDRDIEYLWSFYTGAIGLKKYSSKKDFVRVLAVEAETNDFYLETTYQFNKQGSLILSSICNYNGDLTAYTRYYYDGFNRLIKTIEIRTDEYDIDKIYKEEYFEYSLDDDLISKKTIYTDYPEDTKTESYTLDDNSNITSIIEKDIYKVVVNKLVFKYIFDQFGNWIKKSIYNNDKRTEFTKRNITYY